MLKRHDSKQLLAYIKNELFGTGENSEGIVLNDLIEVLNKYEEENVEET